MHVVLESGHHADGEGGTVGGMNNEMLLFCDRIFFSAAGIRPDLVGCNLQTFSPKGVPNLCFLLAQRCAQLGKPEVGKSGTGSVRFTFGSLTRWERGQRNDCEGGKGKIDKSLGVSVCLRC